MTIVLAVVAGVLFAGGTYLLMQRTLTRSVLAFGLWGHAVNLVLLSAGGSAGRPPIVDPDSPVDPREHADPLAQALALTAIVITFAIAVFLLALAYRSWTQTGEDVAEDDVEDRRIAEHEYSGEDADLGLDLDEEEIA